MNHVSLHGQLQADPQRTSSAIFFTLIVTRPGTNRGADFISCAAFGKVLDRVAGATRGDYLIVEGRLRSIKDRGMVVSIHDVTRL